MLFVTGAMTTSWCLNKVTPKRTTRVPGSSQSLRPPPNYTKMTEHACLHTSASRDNRKKTARARDAMSGHKRGTAAQEKRKARDDRPICTQAPPKKYEVKINNTMVVRYVHLKSTSASQHEGGKKQEPVHVYRYLYVSYHKRAAA